MTKAGSFVDKLALEKSSVSPSRTTAEVPTPSILPIFHSISRCNGTAAWGFCRAKVMGIRPTGAYVSLRGKTRSSSTVVGYFGVAGFELRASGSRSMKPRRHCKKANIAQCCD